MIKDNYEEIIEDIKKATDKKGIKFEDVSIIGVTKTVSCEKIKDLYNLGIKTFGENKVQELLPKIEELPKDILWHFIGTLQSNKVKQIVGKVTLIQSVDSYRLLDEINKCAEKINITQDVLLEINIGLEETKSGINAQNLEEYINYSKSLENIRVLGIMAIPPNLSSEEENILNLKKLRKLFDQSKNFNAGNINISILSMGMSSDYVQAIREGSNMVRIGSAFFGERNY